MPSTGVRVDVCGVTCSTGLPSADNATWIVTEVSGWDSPEQRTGQLAPTGRHGTVSFTSLYGGRTLTVSGAVFADSDADAWAAYYRLCGSMPGLNETGDLIVYESPAKALTVEQSGPPRVSSPVDGLVEFQLTLLASYPFKRSTAEATAAVGSGATISLTNNGTAAAHPVITTTGSGTVDFTIAGRSFTTDAVPSGTVIDMWARSITDGSGEPLSPWPKHSAAEWLSIPRGSVDLVNAGAPLSVSWHDTYA